MKDEEPRDQCPYCHSEGAVACRQTPFGVSFFSWTDLPVRATGSSSPVLSVEDLTTLAKAFGLAWSRFGGGS